MAEEQKLKEGSKDEKSKEETKGTKGRKKKTEGKKEKQPSNEKGKKADLQKQLNEENAEPEGNLKSGEPQSKEGALNEVQEEGESKTGSKEGGITEKKEFIAKVSPGSINGGKAQEHPADASNEPHENSSTGVKKKKGRKASRGIWKADNLFDGSQRGLTSGLFKNSSESLRESPLSSPHESHSKESSKGYLKPSSNLSTSFVDDGMEHKEGKNDKEAEEIRAIKKRKNPPGIKGIPGEHFSQSHPLRKFQQQDFGEYDPYDGSHMRKRNHRKERFYTVAQDLVLLDAVTELRGYTMAVIIQNAIRRDPVIQMDHSFESIRDRIKRKLKKLSPEDVTFMQEWARDNPERTGYVHFKPHERDSKFVEIEVISEEKPNNFSKNNRSSSPFNNENIRNSNKSKGKKKKSKEAHDENEEGCNDDDDDIEKELESRKKSTGLLGSIKKSKKIKDMVKQSPTDSNFGIIHQTGRLIPTRLSKKTKGEGYSLRRANPEGGLKDNGVSRSSKVKVKKEMEDHETNTENGFEGDRIEMLKTKIVELKEMLQTENVEDLANVFVDLVKKDCDENGASVEELKAIVAARENGIKYADFFKLIKVLRK